jgi:hypothetical protein
MKRSPRKWTRKRWRDWERMVKTIKKSTPADRPVNPWAVANTVSKGRTWKINHREGRGKKVNLGEFKRS